MKKILLIIVTLVYAISLASCGDKTNKDNASNTQAPDTQTAENTQKTQEPEQKEDSGPLNPVPGSETIGDVTLTAEFIKLDEPMTVSNASRPCMAMFGDTIYIGDGDKTVRKYTLSDNTVTLVKEMNIANSNGIAVDGKGQLYADGGVYAAKIYDGEGNQIGEAAESGNISISQTEDFASIEVVDNHVLAAGEIEKEQKLVVFDTDGNEVARSSEKLFGSGISAMTETANGYITASANTIHLTKKDGTDIGKCTSTKSLFGTDEAVWLKKFVPVSDGSVLALCGSKRADETAEALLFKIKGF